jgi:ribonuclease P protein component
MLKRQYRLKHSGRIQEIRHTGQSWRNRWLAISVLANEQPQSRFAFSVSRRIGNAVTRNRIKRLMREAVRQYLPLVGGGWDVLLIARSRTRGASFEQMQRAVADLLRASRLWTGPTASMPTADNA